MSEEWVAIGYCFILEYRAVIGYYIISIYRVVIGYCIISEYWVLIVYCFISEYRVLIVQWVRSLDLTAHRNLSPIRRGLAPGFVNKKRCTRLAAASDKVYQLLALGRWFSPGTPAFSITKTGRHDIAEILLKVALNTKNQIIIVFQIIEWLSDITSPQRIELSNIVSFQSRYFRVLDLRTISTLPKFRVNQVWYNEIQLYSNDHNIAYCISFGKFIALGGNA
jgi:hypothetical protein